MREDPLTPTAPLPDDEPIAALGGRTFETAMRERPAKPFPIVKLGIAAILVSGVSAFATMKVIDHRSAASGADQAASLETAPVQMAVVTPTPAQVHVEPLPAPEQAAPAAAPEQAAPAVAPEQVAPAAPAEQVAPAVAQPTTPAAVAQPTTPEPAVAQPTTPEPAVAQTPTPEPAVAQPAQPEPAVAQPAAPAEDSVVVSDDPPERSTRGKRSRGASKKSSRRTATAADTEPAAPRVAKASSRGQGVLMISTKPPCEIVIDGVATMLTSPQRAIKVPAGKHKVTLLNDSLKIEATFPIVVEPNKPTKLIRDLMPKN